QTSPRAAGLTAQVRKTDLMTRLAMMAVRKIERFEAETDEPLVYHQSGSMKIARTPEHHEQLKREVARGQRLGLGIDLVSPAGARTRLVAQMADGRIPVVPTRHQLLITEPIDGVSTAQPIVRVIDSNVYIRPEKGGLMLGGYEPDPVQYDTAALPAGFQMKDL